MAIANMLKVVRDRGGLLRSLTQAAERPGAVLDAARQMLERDWRTVAFDRPATFEALRAEIAATGLIPTLNQRMADAFAALDGATVRERPAVAGGMRALHAELLWSLVRARKPATVVETGVCNGLSSAVLLRALAENGAGTLVSVDVPEFTDPALNTIEVWEGKGGAAIPAGRPVGWLVDETLRGAWRLEIGRSQDILEPLLQEVAPVDLFIHDSEHSYENQLFEFRAGFAALGPGGVLVATDITWSPAFSEFLPEAQAAGARHAYVDPSCAIVIKP